MDSSNGRRCYVMPDKPELLAPPNAWGADAGHYGDIQFSFKSSYTPSGWYRVLAFWLFDFAKVTLPGNPGDITSFHPAALGLPPPPGGLDPGNVYWWLVTAHSAIPATAGGVEEWYPWSEVRHYNTMKKPPPIPVFLPFQTSASDNAPTAVVIIQDAGNFDYQIQYYPVEASNQDAPPPPSPPTIHRDSAGLSAGNGIGKVSRRPSLSSIVARRCSKSISHEVNGMRSNAR